MTGVECIDCGAELAWGEEYQLEGGDDYHAACSECYHDRGVDDR